MGKQRRARPQHDPAYVQLCGQLKKIRTDAGLTQVELGQVFDRPHTFVHKIESGDRRIDPVEFCRWCQACGVDPGEALAPVARANRKKRRS